MGQVIAFPEPKAKISEEPGIDLLTAVDVAIRDLRDIGGRCDDPLARALAEDCRKMLQRAFEDALLTG